MKKAETTLERESLSIFAIFLLITGLFIIIYLIGYVKQERSARKRILAGSSRKNPV